MSRNRRRPHVQAAAKALAKPASFEDLFFIMHDVRANVYIDACGTRPLIVRMHVHRLSSWSDRSDSKLNGPKENKCVERRLTHPVSPSTPPGAIFAHCSAGMQISPRTDLVD